MLWGAKQLQMFVVVMEIQTQKEGKSDLIQLSQGKERGGGGTNESLLLKGFIEK